METAEVYTLSLHDALPILCRRPPPRAALGLRPHQGCRRVGRASAVPRVVGRAHRVALRRRRWQLDRKSTRLNSSHPSISYAVFCLKKKKKTTSISKE